MLVGFFKEDMGKVVTQHFGSRKVNIADASTLKNAMEEILQSYNLNWDQVMSVLLDNCSIMRREAIWIGDPDQTRKQITT